MKKCKYCTNTTPTKQSKICVECKPYIQNVLLFKKLQVPIVKLNKSNELSLNILKNLYFDKNLSLPEISKMFNLQYNTIFDYFKKNNLQLRNNSDAGILSFKENRSKINITKSKYKTGWYTNWEGIKIYYRSSYELKFAEQLDKNKISYDVESLRIEYYDSQTNKIRTAIPDFYLKDSNTIIELKSRFSFNRINMTDKFQSYKKLGYNFVLYVDNKEVQL